MYSIQYKVATMRRREWRVRPGGECECNVKRVVKTALTLLQRVIELVADNGTSNHGNDNEASQTRAACYSRKLGLIAWQL